MITQGLNCHGALIAHGLNPFKLVFPSGLELLFSASLVRSVPFLTSVRSTVLVDAVLSTQRQVHEAVVRAVELDASLLTGVFYLSDPMGLVVQVDARLLLEVKDQDE